MSQRLGQGFIDLADEWAGHRTVRLLTLVALYATAAYPIIDYGLRAFVGVPLVAAVWDEALIAFLVLGVLACLVRGAKIPRLFSAIIPLVALCAAFVVADLNHIGVTLEGLRVVVQFIPFLFIAYYLIEDEEGVIHLLRFLTGVSLFIASLGLVQRIVGVETPAGWADITESVAVRVFSIVQSPNVLGSHMALAVPLAAGLALYERQRGLKYLWAGSAAVMLMTLLMTYSRGAWIAFAGAVLVLAFVLNRRAFIVLLLVVLVVSMATPQIRDRVLMVFSEEYLEKSMLDGRLGRWLRAYNQLRSRPLFGLGPGQYGGAVAARAFGVSYVDNYYVKTAAEMGMVGLAAFVLWLATVLWRGYEVWRRRDCRRRDYLLGGLFCGLLAVAFHNGVENIFEVPYMNSYFWFLSGVLLAYPRLVGEDVEEGSPGTHGGEMWPRCSLRGTASGAAWLLFGLYLVLFYHLVVVPGLLDYSHLALAGLIAGAVGVHYLLPVDRRRGTVTFVLAVLFCTEALNAVHFWTPAGRAAAYILVCAVVVLVARLYGRLTVPQLTAAVLAGLLVISWTPVHELRVYNNFRLLYRSPTLYGGEVFPYFPLEVADVTGDGTAEIITWGNYQEIPDDYQPDPERVLRPESVQPYVYSYDGTTFNRIPPEELTPEAAERALRMIRDHYPGFPYYHLDADGGLEPLLGVRDLVESVLQFGSSPGLALALDSEVIRRRLDEYGGLMDEEAFPEISLERAQLRPGSLELRMSDGRTADLELDATGILGAIRLDGGDALALTGRSVQIIALPAGGGTPYVSHQLTPEELPHVGIADFVIADVTSDGMDELLISSRHGPARIYRPASGGTWEVLWSARPDDTIFRFETVIEGDPPLIVASDPSRIRDYPLRYLSGYHLTRAGLTASWRTMVTLVDVRTGDVFGDGRTALVGSRYGEHEFWVLVPHGLPVIGALWALTAALVLLLVLERRRHGA